MKVKYQIAATMIIVDEQEWDSETTTLERMHADARRSAGIKISQALKDTNGITIDTNAIKVALIIVPDQNKERP